jgi:pre-mRNA-splicing factor SYF2
LDHIKPDLEAYNRQKAVAMGLNPSGSNALTAFSSTEAGSSSAVRAVSSEEQRIAAENLYRDANTLIYGDNKPSEDAIDRVVGKINKEYVHSIPFFYIVQG